MEIIKLGKTDGIETSVILDEKIENELVLFERQVKTIKEQEEQLKQKILEEMENKGILQIKTDNLTISYVAPTIRETFDSKKFKEEHPRQYDKYIKVSDVKSSIRIKVDN